MIIDATHPEANYQDSSVRYESDIEIVYGAFVFRRNQDRFFKTIKLSHSFPIYPRKLFKLYSKSFVPEPWGAALKIVRTTIPSPPGKSPFEA